MTKKTFIIATTIIAILNICTSILCTNIKVNKTTDSYYPLNTVVQEINKETDTVTCVDYNGNLWEFYGVEDWQEGDFATMIMNTRGTTNIFDDEIIKVEYNGNVGGLD